MLSMLANRLTCHKMKDIETLAQTQKELVVARSILPRRGHQKIKMFGTKV